MKVGTFAMVAVFVLVALMTFSSAQTVIVGKVYSLGLSNDLPISGATVNATCDGQAMGTRTQDDGSYGMQFDESKCTAGMNVHVSAYTNVSDGKSGYGDDVIVRDCQGNCTDNLIAVANFALKVPYSGTNDVIYVGGGGGGGSHGSGYVVNLSDTGSSSSSGNTSNDSAVELNPKDVSSSGNQAASGGGITGAVIGALSTPMGIIIVIFFVLIVGASIAVYILRSKN